MTMATVTKTTISVAELDEMIEHQTLLLLLDVRKQGELQRWQFAGRNLFESVHIT